MAVTTGESYPTEMPPTPDDGGDGSLPDDRGHGVEFETDAFQTYHDGGRNQQ